MNWLKLKGYAIHGIASVIVFSNASVQAWVGTHKTYAGAVLLAYGWLLHWSDGK